jgi:putative ABC transport system ATP-binding protein
MLVQADDLRRTYRMGRSELHALRGVCLEVSHGEFVAIMGASGCGKSTLLHLLGCLDLPTAGAYRLDGTAVGFVFQAFNLISQHSILENVELPLIYGNMGKRTRRERSLELLRQVGLEDRINHRPTELSGGEVQRAAIARALAVQPLLLLADEPTGNLDSQTGEGILRLFTDLNDRGMTIIMVTHSREVADHAGRIIEMRDGLIVKDSKAPSPASVSLV